MTDKIRVLLVDDEEQFVKNMSRILKFRGFEVTTALSGYEAIDAIKYGGGFDVVVLDIKMPGMDGMETLGQVKKWAPDTEVIMLTGHATLSSGSQALQAGAYDYLMKPCDVEDLVEKIREAHEAERMRRHPVLWPRKLVREIVLHEFAHLGTDTPLTEALELMRRGVGEEAVEEIFIVDEEKRLLGAVTKRELVDTAQKAHPQISLNWTRLIESPQWLPEKTLKEVMRHDPVSTQGNAYLTDAANQMLVHNVRSMPVVRAGKILGVIRLQDVFHYLDNEIE
ncbi:MAG: response regulator [Deltaproteobacteria bacterium]|nr:response regulator [Deltaproteobacteria bacterium]